MAPRESTLESTKIKSTVSSFPLINLLVRVGGGFLSIDEFLDQYTPAELDKMQRNDPLKKFSEKVSVQKTLTGKEVRESSPIRSPTIKESPKKAPPSRGGQ